MGNLMVDAVRNADLPLIQTIGLTYCVVVLLINTVVDGLYVVSTRNCGCADARPPRPFAAFA
jgi:ABC-type dipeptide/oligopeptide/nickel transport system permease component